MNDKIKLKIDTPPNCDARSPPIIIADTGCTGHYLNTDAPVVNKRPAQQPISVMVPNGGIMQSTHTADLHLPTLPDLACKAHIFPHMASGSLISIGQLCDFGCQAKFTAKTVTITKQGVTVLRGTRPANGVRLWTLELPSPAPPAQAPVVHQANSMIPVSSIADRISFVHAALFSPTLSSWAKAERAGYLSTFPKITSAQLLSHPPNLLASMKGHLDQQRANTRSTKSPTNSLNNVSEAKLEEEAEEEEEEFTRPPQTEPPAERTNHIYLSFQPITGQIYSDPTGRFILPSSAGNTGMLVVYDYDSNAILVQPTKTNQGPDLLAAYKTAHARLVRAGLKPKLQRLDNEASKAMCDYMQSEGIDYQLVPPHLHRRNAAERAIRTWKNHFVAGLCSTAKDFPLHLWDELIEQGELTMNILRGSRINPKLSAHAQIHGAFDFNKTPLAPPGTQVLVHEKPAVRETWAPHAVDGYYIGPAMNHYRCFRVWITETRATRIADTLAWFPEHVCMPHASNEDLAVAALQDLARALKHPAPSTPFAAITDSQVQQIQDVADLFTSVKPRRRPSIRAPKNRAAPQQASPQQVTFQEDSPQVPRVSPAEPTAVPTAAPLPRVPTYAELTVNPGKRRRREKARAKKAASDAVRNEHLATRVASNKAITAQQLKNKKRRQERRPARASKDHLKAQKAKRQQAKTTSALARATLSPKSTRSVAVHPHRTRSKAPSTRKSPAVLLGEAFSLNSATAATPLIPIPYELYTATHSANVATAILLPPQHQACGVIDPVTGEDQEYNQLKKGPDAEAWIQSCANEIGRLAQGVQPHMDSGTETIHFIRWDQLPADRKATYLRIVSKIRPEKKEKFRVRFTCGGDKVDYPGKVSTRTCDMTTAKCLFNSVLSTPKAKFMTIDIANFYLNTPMERYEYMRIPVHVIPDCIMEQYKLAGLVRNGYVLVEIRKGMYGLPQAGIIANERLQAHLNTFGYYECKHTHGLFRHESKDITFSLCVDDFGVKYIHKADAQHLIDALAALYSITTDWNGELYLGLTLKWDYTARTVDISMPDYVANALNKFQHDTPKKKEHSPHSWIPPNYGAKTQFTQAPDRSAPLDAAGITRLQEVIGTLLFYARAVDSTMLVALGSLSSAQAHGTQATAKAVTQLLNYAATHPDATVRYHASGMILHIHSDASYLSEAKARSRAGGIFFLSDLPTDPTKAPKPTDKPPPLNGALHIHSSIIRAVMSSATEAELAALFYNCKEAITIRTTLEELGHSQPATPVQTDNACAAGIVNDTVKQKRSKAIDMRFYWVKDRVEQDQFIVHWRKGADNLGDYFTKHHATSHHQLMRHLYLLSQHVACEGVLISPTTGASKHTTSLPFTLHSAQAAPPVDMARSFVANCHSAFCSTLCP